MAGVVWLASYPKSGNTWVRLLLANLLSGKNQAVDINQIAVNACNIVNRLHVEELTLIDTNLLSKEETYPLRPLLADFIAEQAAAENKDVFVKLHDAYFRLHDGTPLTGKTAARALYFVRDPRDVAVSLSFHCGFSIDTAIDRLLSADTRMGGKLGTERGQLPQPLLDWSNHVRSWTRQNDVPIHVCRYEDLRADTAEVFSRILGFLQIGASQETVEQAVSFADFTELQQQEAEKGFRERQAISTAPFFRSGRVCEWVDALTPEQAAAIVAAHGEVMAEFGYL
ncbi:sulfotransferase domain-containing protein [Methylomonas fluvii]|uniref:Sulfotransferase domain-containing protein n=1 Tax=Methylomonas fluvii TaxID=1854564 RepID=A0ABR9DJK9_9GAMM|nr:sulfotransferase domain-containing protein [Methylomonas fluvii]MBD9362424.1 sulfotransferase domain-containing protein [Methylomonas fluvii]